MGSHDRPVNDATASGEEAGAELTVIVADNYDDTRAMLKYIFEAEGFHVTATTGGFETVRAALHERPQLLLLDLGLPDLDGYAVARLLRQHEGLRHLPVVAITAYEDAYPREEALAAGCSDYVREPLTIEKLRELIHKYLRRDGGIYEPNSSRPQPQ